MIPPVPQASALALCIVCLACCATAAAQGLPDPSKSAPDPCRAEVSRFEQVIGFVRQSQGTEAAALLKEKLLPAKVEEDLLFREGYCGLAKYLRERKLTR